ncbi:N-acetylglucosamine-6-phosphate deacetylase [hydrothermal vent metagenome]|uniref:N-acetylglucosamine-6-phosphate deacetylase n=1 Tax=hydrothermal vent metagenome TaxID=652676 RepID=A0A3B1D7U1_9ZZZZ
MQLQARRYETGEPVIVTVAGEKIQSVVPLTFTGDVTALPYLAPGLFDLQINGYGGVWFGKVGITPEEVLTTLKPHFQYGITRLCPTLITNSQENLLAGFDAICQACEQEEWVNNMVPGCHLEGPYIATEDGPRGAHPLEHVRAANWNEFEELQQASGNRIKLVTLAPEAEGAIEFITKAVDAGVVISIGHTGATPRQITAAVDAGAKLSTHLGNGAHGVMRRHPNYIWEQLGDSRLMASIITDGHHLPASVVRVIIATKKISGTIITCDAAGLAGCPPGQYTEGSLEVEILEDGRIVIAGQDQLLAGSSLETDTCVTTAMEMAGLTLQQAFDMAGRNPARLLGYEQIELKAGSRADLVLFYHAGAGKKIDIIATVAAGILQYGTILDTATL